MKKEWIMITSIIAVMLTACGEEKNQHNVTPGSEENQIVESENANESTEQSMPVVENVSLETLLSHEESAATDFDYWTDGEYAYIDGYLGSDVIVVIPEKLDGCPIKEVGILKGKGIQAIKYSNTVELIRESSFSFDTDLRYVVLGSNVKTIGKIAFERCKNLEYVQLNDSLEEIGEAALCFISAKEIKIPESVIAIGDAAFNMDDTQTIYVKAGSFAESWCGEWKGYFADFNFVVE